MRKLVIILATALIAAVSAGAQTETALHEGWKFAFGNAADPAKDFGCGTEYFSYLTKANSIHSEGPYSAKFDGRVQFIVEGELSPAEAHLSIAGL